MFQTSGILRSRDENRKILVSKADPLFLTLIKEAAPNRFIGRFLPFIEETIATTELVSLWVISDASLYQQERNT
ncbi:MAG: hypothetical protein ABIQ88_08635 [Chitinophagaceae bacterium]